MAYKMKGFSGFGNSPLKQKGHPASTGGTGDIVKKAVKKHFPETYEKVKDVVGKVKEKAKEVGRKGELLLDSGIYSNKYMAENPTRFSKSKINQPRFKAEKKKLLKK